MKVKNNQKDGIASESSFCVWCHCRYIPYMFIPVLDARFDPRDQLFYDSKLISSRGWMRKSAICKEPPVQGILDMGLPQDLTAGKIKVSFQLQVLAAEALDAHFIHWAS